MARWHKRLLCAITATSVMLGAGPAATAVGAAEEAVLIPGATVFKRINPLYPITATTYPISGSTFTTMTTRSSSSTRRTHLIRTGPSWTAWSKRTSLCARTTAKS